MAINYTYPGKGNPVLADEFLIIDSADNITRKVSVKDVLALGTGVVAGVSSFTASNSTFISVSSTAGQTGGATLTSSLSAVAEAGSIDNTKFLRGDNKWATVVSSISGTLPISVSSSNVVSLGTVPVAKGGTNLTSYTAGDIIYSTAATTIAKLPIGTQGHVLTVSSGNLPIWSSVGAFVSSAGGTMSGNLNMEGNSVISSANPGTANTLTRKAYVDAAAALKLSLSGGAMTGAITTNSTFDGVDVGARNNVLTSTTTTASAALPKTGGTMTGSIAGVRLITRFVQSVNAVANGTTFNPGNGSFGVLNVSSSISSVAVTLMPEGTTATLFLNNTTSNTSIGAWVDSSDSPIKWAGLAAGARPTITTSANKTDIVKLEFLGGAIYASISQNYA